ncbi:MAG: N-acetyltransferase family protein [bacterium]
MIRPATAADAPALAALWNPWIESTAITFASTPKTATDLAEMIATRPAFFTTDDLAGLATYSQFRGGNGYATCMEHSVILAPNARGRGLGRALLQAVESHAQSHGAHQMIAGISGENPAAITFHAHLGYTEVARIAQAGYKFGRFMDLVLMQKFLT